MGDHRVRARVRASMGARRKITGEDEEGRTGSLIKSFTPSAMGWSRPNGPTTLGPFRSCMYPKTFRSINVRNATARRTGTINIKGLTR